MEYPKTPADLMRSRYEAFKSKNEGWLRLTWHPVACPVDIDLPNVEFTELEIVREDWTPGDDFGVVEFKAFYRNPDGGTGCHHEVSRFELLNGKWVYDRAVGI